jgi:DNA-binding HxlR family transcriptional regulator
MTDPSCPVCATADIVCGKWTILVIRDLAEGRTRFCELERSLQGISPRTLSLRLRELALERAAGVVRVGREAAAAPLDVRDPAACRAIATAPAPVRR